MEGTPAIYLGRIVEKENFRVFIYDKNGQSKLVESWEEFEASMQSGLWFATLQDTQHKKVKKKSRAKPKPNVVEEAENVLQDNNGSVFEVIDGA